MRLVPVILSLSIPFVFAFGKSEQPNVLFIVCDDLNTHVSTSGYEHIKTPAFDKLAETGMTFNRAYCQYPVCNSSRTSFLHSLYPQSSGVVSNKVDIRETRPGTVSMPQLFKENGYWTAATGKVYHNLKSTPGKDTWDESHWFDNDEMPMVIPVREAFEKKHGPVTDRKNVKKWKEIYYDIATQTKNQKPGYGPSGLRDDQHKDGKNALKVIEWLEKESFGDKPFFISLGIHKPHGPFLAPDKYFDLYPKDELQFSLASKDFWKQAPREAGTKRYEGFDFEFGVENDALRRANMQAYHACISFIDAQIGLVLDALEETGKADNTIVVLISDHGYHLGDHFMWGKVTLFEICARVPMLVRAPGITRPGSKSEGLVELLDIFPTLTEICGLEDPEHVQGQSFLRNMKNSEADGKEVVYTVVTRGKNLGQAVRTERWRYAKWSSGEELYDLKKDPGELKNLAGSPEHAGILQKMRNHLEEIDARAGEKR
ncbi:sulfatase [Pelagicoccus mobilis]|uniref:Sulfatase n=1 Tax=Pelagicoccus mobilis TaxID=415221 RepID=A0A934VSG9_9BACT|nr:sulfatase [Pelagicoccus mobilis]MBK1879005.1 sulfatase [Pelagicoccus mobilis]